MLHLAWRAAVVAAVAAADLKGEPVDSAPAVGVVALPDTRAAMLGRRFAGQSLNVEWLT